MDAKTMAMVGASNYSLALRVIGQVLEARDPEDFDLESYDNGFLVRGTEKVVSHETSVLRMLLAKPRLPQRGAFEVSYNFEEVEQLDWEGRSKRSDPNALPDFYSLAQILRTVGEYVDLRSARLLGIARRGVRLTLQYENGEGKRTTEEHTVASFYNMFMGMYMHRSGRYQS